MGTMALLSSLPTLKTPRVGVFPTPLHAQSTQKKTDNARPYDTIQYNTVRYDTMQYNTTQYDTIRYDATRYDAIRYNTTQYNTIRYDTIHYDTLQYNAIRCNAMQYNTWRPGLDLYSLSEKKSRCGPNHRWMGGGDLIHESPQALQRNDLEVGDTLGHGHWLGSCLLSWRHGRRPSGQHLPAAFALARRHSSHQRQTGLDGCDLLCICLYI